MMTQERREQILARNEGNNHIDELLAEIDRLNKTLDQAISWIPESLRDDDFFLEMQCESELRGHLMERRIKV
jgi:hypothetical protein